MHNLGRVLGAYSGIGIAGMIRIILSFRASEPVNSVTMKVLQPLWNESSPRTNNCLTYSYSGIAPSPLKQNIK